MGDCLRQQRTAVAGVRDVSADRPSDLCSQLGGLSRRSEYEIGDPSTASAIIHLSSSFESDERGCAPGHNVVISYGDGDVERMPRIELA